MGGVPRNRLSNHSLGTLTTSIKSISKQVESTSKAGQPQKSYVITQRDYKSTSSIKN